MDQHPDRANLDGLEEEERKRRQEAKKPGYLQTVTDIVGRVVQRQCKYACSVYCCACISAKISDHQRPVFLIQALDKFKMLYLGEEMTKENQGTELGMGCYGLLYGKRQLQRSSQRFES
jgi:hypothetical protein